MLLRLVTFFSLFLTGAFIYFLKEIVPRLIWKNGTCRESVSFKNVQGLCQDMRWLPVGIKKVNLKEHN